MNRPASIVLFERFYLGSLVVWLIGLVVFWTRFQHDIAVATARYPANIAAMGPAISLGSIAIAIVFTLALWFFTARKASLTASWIVVITEAIAALSLLLWVIRLATGHGEHAPGDLVGRVSTLLAVIGAGFLLRPDARTWLGASRPSPGIEQL